MSANTIIVIAKAPIPGRVKTRLSPPLTTVEAAELAAAALHDTIRAAVTSGASRVVVAFEGDPDNWLADVGVDVIPQRGGGLDQRIAAAFSDVGTPALLIGMDTPQAEAGVLASALVSLTDHDAVLGLAEDGGFWALGVKIPHADLFLGVPMSTKRTGAAQLQRLHAAGLDVGHLATLRDVDDFTDALAVASMAPETRFARAVASRVGVGMATP